MKYSFHYIGVFLKPQHNNTQSEETVSHAFLYDSIETVVNIQYE